MSFAQKVYDLCKKVQRGKVTTYKAIADALNTSPRAVGQALKSNPYAPEVPCYRVVKSNGMIGGFRGKINGKEIEIKIAMLAKEGVIVHNNKIADFEKIVIPVAIG